MRLSSLARGVPRVSRRALSEAVAAARLAPSQLFIDGESVAAEGGRAFATHSPRDGSVLTEVADASPGDVDRAVAAAAAFLGRARGEAGGADAADARAWAASVERRCATLRAMGAAMRERREELAALESLDCGKPLGESRADIDVCADLCDYYADVAPAIVAPRAVADDVDGSGAGVVTASVAAEPAGVVALITPWNYPLMQAVVKVAPALAAGCGAVLKPSPLASLTCARLGALASRAGAPRGALNVVTGGPGAGAGALARGASAGERLAAHDGVDKLSFTGSGATGRTLLGEGAARLRPTSLELGGKGAMVVLDDADLDAVVDWAMVGIFVCAGQVCSATSRLVVDERVADELCARLAAATRARLVVGDPLDAATNMGPCVSAAQRDKVVAAAAAARADARCEPLLGGDDLSAAAKAAAPGGFFAAPELFRVRPDAAAASAAAERWPALWRDEIFGPVLAVGTFPAGDLDAAVAMANDTPYGLANAVMSRDAARCARVAAALRSGVVWQNCSQALGPATPFGGCKESGFGREFGEAGLHEYLHHKTIIAAPAAHTWNWFG